MRLKERLQKMPPDKPIKVGCNDGSSYFYGGTAGDMLDNMEQYALNMELASVDAVTRAVTAYRQAANAKILPVDYCIGLMDEKDPEYTLNAYKKFLESYFRNVERRKSYLDTARYRRDRFIPLPDREVTDCFEADAIVDEGVTAIMVEGTEFGKFWCTDEAAELPCMKLMSETAHDERQEA